MNLTDLGPSINGTASHATSGMSYDIPHKKLAKTRFLEHKIASIKQGVKEIAVNLPRHGPSTQRPKTVEADDSRFVRMPHGMLANMLANMLGSVNALICDLENVGQHVGQHVGQCEPGLRVVGAREG